MIHDRPISFRFPIALVLSFVCLAMPAWADFQSGMDAADRGNYETALREWRPLAEQGDAYAQHNLGVLYANGQGVPEDYVQARQWYEKAAAQGRPESQFYLGVLYANGQGVPQDFVQAHMWYNLAAAHGEKDGAELRDGLAEQMTPAQIAEAHKRAREWKPTTP